MRVGRRTHMQRGYAWGLAVAGVLLVGLGGYRGYVGYSMRQEAESRLQDPVLQARLAPVQRAGDPDRPAILLLHGFGGSPYDMRPLLEQIPLHYTVHVPCLPGHGRKRPQVLSRVTAADWRSFVLAEAGKLAEAHTGVILCGFSLGGLLALDLADALQPDAVIAINPYVGTPYKAWYLLPPNVWVRGFGTIVPYIKKVKSGQIADPAGVRQYEPGYWHLSMRALGALQAYTHVVQRQAPPLSVPAYLHISGQDIVSDPGKMRALAQQLGMPREHVQVWPASNHVLLYDADAKDAIAAIVAQIEAHGSH